MMRTLLIWLLVFSTFVGVGCDFVGAPPVQGLADFAAPLQGLADFATPLQSLSDFATPLQSLADFAPTLQSLADFAHQGPEAVRLL